MSRIHNLRNGAKVIDDVEVDVFAEEVRDGKAPVDDCNTLELMNRNLCEQLVDKFGTRVMDDLGAIVESLKSDLLAEFKKRDERFLNLESEVICLRDSMAISAVKLAALEAKVASLSANPDIIVTPPPHPPRPSIDTVFAGDSILKHVNVESIEGVNRLICLPGARSLKVHAAVRSLAKTTDIKKPSSPLRYKQYTSQFRYEHLQRDLRKPPSRSA